MCRPNPQIRPLNRGKKSAVTKNTTGKNQKTNGTTNGKRETRIINRRTDDKLKNTRKDSVTSSSSVSFFFY